MGIGNWLRSLFSGGKTRVAKSDHIWMTTAAKLRGIVGDVEADRLRGDVLLVVAHFSNTLAGLERLFAGSGRPYELIADSIGGRDLTNRLARAREGIALLVLSDALPEIDDDEAIEVDPGKQISIILTESHPLPNLDERLRKLAAALPFHVRLQTHLSLEDAVMRVFAGEWVTGMLRRLGMKEDEAIQSDMVMKRIREAQRKIEREAVGAVPAESAEEWFRLNCPTLWKYD